MSRFNPGKTSAAGGTCSEEEATSFTSGFCGGAGRPQRLRSLIYRNFSYHAQEVLLSNSKNSCFFFKKKESNYCHMCTCGEMLDSDGELREGKIGHRIHRLIWRALRPVIRL